SGEDEIGLPGAERFGEHIVLVSEERQLINDGRRQSLTYVECGGGFVQLAVGEEVERSRIAYSNGALALFGVTDGVSPGIGIQQLRRAQAALESGLQRMILARAVRHAPVDRGESRTDQRRGTQYKPGIEIARRVEIFTGK